MTTAALGRAAQNAASDGSASDSAPRPDDAAPERSPEAIAAAERAQAARERSAGRSPLVVPVTGIFLLLSIHSMIYAAPFLIPVTTAILGYFILNAPRRWLGKIGIPAPVAAALFTLTLAAVLVLGGLALADPISTFVTDIPDLIGQTLRDLTGPGGLLRPFTEAADATKEVLGAPPGAPMQVEVVDNAGIATSVAAFAPGLLSQLVFAICLLFFLVASGDLFIQKAVQVVDRFEDKKTTVATIHAIERRLGNYLGAITLINISLGICIGLAMWWWGLPSPWLIGLMATVLNFVPYVGAIAGCVIAGVIAFVTYDEAWTALGVTATYYAFTAMEGQFITPAALGQRLRLNVTMVFLSVAFFAWIWSVMGMVVAVPMLIVLKVVCDAIPKLRKVGLFLGEAEGFVPNQPRRD